MMALAGCSDDVNGGFATLRFIDQHKNPVAVGKVAFQDGDMNWMPIKQSSVGVYRHSVTNPEQRYGFAYIDEVGILHVQQCTLSESNTLTSPVFRQTPGSNTVSGALTGIPDGNSCEIWLGGKHSSPVEGTSEYTFSGIGDETYDLIAVLYDMSEPADYLPNKVLVHRNVTVNGPVEQPIDFTAVGLPDTYELTITSSTTPIQASANYFSTDGCWVLMGGVIGTSSLTYAAIPGVSQPRDYYGFSVQCSEQKDSTLYAHSASNKTVVIPDTEPFSFTIADRTLTWSDNNDVCEYYVELQEADTYAQIEVSSGWLNGDRHYDIPTLAELTDRWGSSGTLTGLIDQTYMTEVISDSAPEAFIDFCLGNKTDDIQITRLWSSSDAKMVKRTERPERGVPPWGHSNSYFNWR